MTYNEQDFLNGLAAGLTATAGNEVEIVIPEYFVRLEAHGIADYLYVPAPRLYIMYASEDGNRFSCNNSTFGGTTSLSNIRDMSLKKTYGIILASINPHMGFRNISITGITKNPDLATSIIHEEDYRSFGKITGPIWTGGKPRLYCLLGFLKNLKFTPCNSFNAKTLEEIFEENKERFTHVKP